MTQWLEVRVTVRDAVSAELVFALLSNFTADETAIALQQLGDPASLDPEAMLPEREVTLVVDGDADSAELRSAIALSLRENNLPLPHFRRVDEEDWANAWKVHYRPLAIGNRFWVVPSWEPAQTYPQGSLIITLDPGMAFGTGTHQTTQSCLMGLEKVVQAGDAVLDLGTGSGILAIGAVLLGAERVLAVDTDKIAVSATQYNVELNQSAEQITIAQGSLEVVPHKEWDVVVANILAVVLLQMLRDDALLSYVRPNGYLLLSGIVKSQLPQMEGMIAQVGGVLREVIEKEEWVTLVVQAGGDV